MRAARQGARTAAARYVHLAGPVNVIGQGAKRTPASTPRRTYPCAPQTRRAPLAMRRRPTNIVPSELNPRAPQDIAEKSGSHAKREGTPQLCPAR